MSEKPGYWMVPVLEAKSEGPFRMLVSDDGIHVPVGEYGYGVTFFLPLPEPLLLPDLYMVPSYSWLSLEEVISQSDELKPFRCHRELEVSLCFRRIEHDADPDPTVGAVWSATRAAMPRLATPPEGKKPSTENLPAALTTVVEVYALVASLDQEALTEAIDRGLAATRQVQRAYGKAVGRAVTPLTRERCPLTAVIHAYPPDTAFHQRPTEQVFFVLNPSAQPSTEDPLLTADQLDAFEYHRALNDEHLGVPPGLALDGFREIIQEGNVWAGLALLASACECYLDLLLTCLMWEEGRRPEEASKVFDQVLVQRIKKAMFSDRLEGDWDIDGDGPVGSWFRNVATPRNSMLHTGRTPSQKEANEAMSAYNELVKHIGERLLANAAKYPRTMWMILGADQVPVNARVHVEPLLESPDEPDWKATSMKWSEVMRNGTRFGAWRESTVSADNARTVLVIHPDGQRTWLMVDEAAHRAKELSAAPSEISSQALASAEGIQPGEEFGTVAFGAPQTDQEGPWLPAYRLLPLHQVMVSGESLDYDQC
ncbi:MAG: hypothetical protein ACJAR2_002762 [Ilumatobacter sp.]|jgi:hypothetical protein